MIIMIILLKDGEMKRIIKLLKETSDMDVCMNIAKDILTVD